MKKPYKYNELSHIHCVKCGKPLKKNVIERKPTADTCYQCSRVARLNQSEVRNA